MPIVAIATAYAIGSIPFALILARRWGAADLRRIGSGNLGAANVWRATGARAALLVAALDIGKGAAGVLVARALNVEAPAAPAAAGVAAVLGHIYPVWLGFRGGKGVATSCGVFAVLAPHAVLPVLVVFVVTVWVTKYVSVGSVMASVALPPITYAIGSSRPESAAAVGVASLIVFCHRSNLKRVLAGTERRVGAAVAPGDL